MPNIVPIKDIRRQMPVHGRIRLGVRVPATAGRKASMKSIPNLRFTSPDKLAIEQLAELYGGEARPWSDEKASPRNQFEVITETNTIPVFLPPDALWTGYEQWSGGGIARRCDGENVEMAHGDEMVERPCICWAKQALECKIQIRLNLVIPSIRFGGSWRLDSHSETALHELPGMVDMISMLQVKGMAAAELRIDSETKMKFGKRRNFIVPRLLIPETPMAMLAGAASVASIGRGDGTVPALGTGTPPAVASPDATPAVEAEIKEAEWFEDPADDDIVDAELVPESAPPPEDPGEPARTGPDPKKQQQKLVIMCSEIATVIRTQALQPEGDEPITDDELRHAVSWWASRGKTESSKELDVEQKSKVLDALTTASTQPADAIALVGRYRERPL